MGNVGSSISGLDFATCNDKISASCFVTAHAFKGCGKTPIEAGLVTVHDFTGREKKRCSTCFVTGHDFSRAANAAHRGRASAPAECFLPRFTALLFLVLACSVHAQNLPPGSSAHSPALRPAIRSSRQTRHPHLRTRSSKSPCSGRRCTPSILRPSCARARCTCSIGPKTTPAPWRSGCTLRAWAWPRATTASISRGGPTRFSIPPPMTRRRASGPAASKIRASWKAKTALMY